LDTMGQVIATIPDNTMLLVRQRESTGRLQMLSGGRLLGYVLDISTMGLLALDALRPGPLGTSKADRSLSLGVSESCAV
jgi:hypothetical protein